MKISIICVYNNEKQYEEQLVKSLKVQDVDYQLIGIKNIHNEFSSAAKALNYGVLKSDGDILIFTHQDIQLKTPKELREICECIKESEVGTIIGTQGVKEPSHQYYTNLTSGSVYDDKLITDYKKKLYEVSCVDEGFFGMRRETWDNHHFDEQLCDNWHLYCVEQCLWNRRNGGKVYVYPTQLHHYSKGTITKDYMDNLKLLCQVYRKDFKYIWTTCYKVRTNIIYISCLVFAWKLNRIIRGKYK